MVPYDPFLPIACNIFSQFGYDTEDIRDAVVFSSFNLAKKGGGSSPILGFNFWGKTGAKDAF